MISGKELDNAGLNAIGVLVFVHHDMAVACRKALADRRVLIQQKPKIVQEIIIIH